MFGFLSNIWTGIKNVTSNIFNKVSGSFKYVFSGFFSTLGSLVFKGKQELSTTNIDYKQQDIIDDQNKKIEELKNKEREEKRLEQLKQFGKSNDKEEGNIKEEEINQEINNNIESSNAEKLEEVNNEENNINEENFNNDVVDTNLDNYQISITPFEFSIIHIITKKTIYRTTGTFTNIKGIESIVNNYNPRNIFGEDGKIRKDFINYLVSELLK